MKSRRLTILAVLALAAATLCLGLVAPSLAETRDGPPQDQAAESVLAADPQGPVVGTFVQGRVIGLGATELTIDAGSETWTVTVTEETTFRLQDVDLSSLTELEGKVVLVRGSVTGQTTMTATAVAAPMAMGSTSGQADSVQQVIESLKRGRRVSGTLRGEVLAVDDDSLTVKAGEDEVEVSVDAETRYVVPDVEDATLADISVGQLVMVSPGADKDAPARAVAVVTEAQMRRLASDQRLYDQARRLLGSSTARGEIASLSVDGETTVLAIETPQGQITVYATANTHVHDANEADIALDALAVGDTIVVVGRAVPGNDLNAGAISLAPAPAE